MNKDKISKKNSIVNHHNLNKFIIITNVFHFDKDGKTLDLFLFSSYKFCEILIITKLKKKTLDDHMLIHMHCKM